MKLHTLNAVAAVLTLSLISCGNNNSKKQEVTQEKEITTQPQVTTPPVADNVTYQHIALANIKDEKWDAYIDAMHNNIANSRKEPGNIIFTLFQPEDGTHKVAFMERFKNRTVFGEHIKAPYLPEQITKESLIGDMEIRELKELTEIPAVEPSNADVVVTPRNVIVFFEVKPEQRATFIKALSQLTPNARKAEGNVRFNVFEEVANKNKFVLLESWNSIENHEKHLAKEYSKVFNNAVKNIFVTNPMDTRMLTKDISL